jgi:pyruvate carboxylase
MYYGQEAPGLPRFIEKGLHFEAGQPLYVLEVMKMFNKIVAPFSGTIDDVLVEGDGVIVSKGQPIFKVTPDEKIVDEDPVEVAARRKAQTREYLGLA